MEFIPERLATLRHMKQLSLRELGERVGVSHTAISNYEKGEDRPRPSILIRLATVFEVSTEYFFKPLTMEVSSISYRKTSDLTKMQQNAVEAQVKERVEKYTFIEEVTNSAKSPQLPKEKFLIKEIENAEEAARQLRSQWDLGGDSLPNVTEILEDKGIKVVFVDFEDSFSGLSLLLNDAIPVIVCNRNLPGDRQRFTLLHELGHMVLDVAPDISEEAACHRFAAAFLIPQAALFEKVGRKRSAIHLDELFILKQEYGISLQSLIKRCYELGVITESTYSNFMKKFNKKGWRKQEPGDAVCPENSYRFNLLLKRAMAENVITTSQTMELLEILPSRTSTVSAEELAKQALDAKDLYADKELTIFTDTNVEDIYSYED